MIRNERQYKITRTQANNFRKALAELLAEPRATALDADLKLKLQEGALSSQLGDLEEEIREYEQLQQHRSEVLEVTSLTELPQVLVKARIASGLTQKQLAESLHLKEQQIQRYEASNYKGVSLERMQEVIDALGVKLSGQAFIPAEPDLPATVFTS